MLLTQFIQPMADFTPKSPNFQQIIRSVAFNPERSRIASHRHPNPVRAAAPQFLFLLCDFALCSLIFNFLPAPKSPKYQVFFYY